MFEVYIFSMKRIYTFTVEQTYAGRRSGEIEVEIDLDDGYEHDNNIDETQANEIAYEKYIEDHVEWEDRRGYDDGDTDYDIDLDNSYLVDDDGDRIRGDGDD